ncbi:MAG: phosphoserine phosphatase SerB [Rhizobiaceae bacterium]|nr:phosphoserine phosphatase SerB [Rhizobiaceae bacterium]
MPLVATLISNPAAAALSLPLAKDAARLLEAKHIEWLAADVACDLALPQGATATEAQSRLAPLLASAPIDVAIQESAGRRKKLLIADMDSTMIDQECIDELGEAVGLKSRIAAITARAMNGEIDFEPALRERVALLAGLDEAVIDQVVKTRITLASGGRELVATMNRDGAWTALVSGGFDAFTSRIAVQLGFQENRANRLIVENGKLTGRVAAPIMGREAKAAALRDITAKRGITPAEALAVGDGANDLDMINLAGTGVALHAKPAVAAAARIRIDHGDLTALLYLQGYRREQFAP